MTGKKHPTFFLNHEKLPRSSVTQPVDQTVLEYLRKNGLTGTKEGCASGDCGACTAVTAHAENGGLTYTPINTCITFLHTIAGRLLITVEGLTDAGKPHPVQQSMVKNHASQCGFCTPGFVMALFAHIKESQDRSSGSIKHSIAGNLCRCTGYRPIVAAGMELKSNIDDYYSLQESGIKKNLTSLHPAVAEGFVIPQSIAELERYLVKHPEARILAGGTDLALEYTQGNQRLPQLVYIGAIETMNYIEERDNAWHIGAATTYAKCLEELGSKLPEFGAMLIRFGSHQIRSQATVGGNIANASPIADGPPVFMVLGTTLTINRGGSRRQVTLEDFYTGYKQTVLEPSEFIENLTVQMPNPEAFVKVFKISKRLEDDISAVCGAFNILVSKGVVTHARVAFGGMSATPQRALQCEQALIGSKWTMSTIEKVSAALSNDFNPISDMRASAEYRNRVAVNLLRKLYLEGSSTVRVETFDDNDR